MTRRQTRRLRGPTVSAAFAGLLLLTAGCGDDGPGSGGDSEGDAPNGPDGEEGGGATEKTLPDFDPSLASFPSAPVDEQVDAGFEPLDEEGCDGAEEVLETESTGEERLYEAAARMCRLEFDEAESILLEVGPSLSTQGACDWYETVAGEVWDRSDIACEVDPLAAEASTTTSTATTTTTTTTSTSMPGGGTGDGETEGEGEAAGAIGAPADR